MSNPCWPTFIHRRRRQSSFAGRMRGPPAGPASPVGRNPCEKRIKSTTLCLPRFSRLTLWRFQMKTLVLETTSPFQGLPELVAYDEGLFEKEGIKIEWAERDEAGVKSADTSLTDVKGANPFGSHGTLLEQGKADMYNACEWGNYCRAGATSVGSRQIGRRAIVTYAAIVVRPDSAVYTPQQLAGRTVGVPFYAGTHYLALHLLEGFLPRDQINVCRAP